MIKDKAHQGQRVRYSFLNILTGSDLFKRKLPLMEIESEVEGPVVWLAACAHGDEVGGIVIIQEVFKRLRRKPLLKGSVYAFPLMNPLGFETLLRNVTLSDEDLNRSFPGNQQGSLAQRIAEMIFTRIKETNPSVVLDLHNDWRMSIPYALIDPHPGSDYVETYEMVKVIARKTGFIIISEEREAQDSLEWERTLTGSLIKSGIPALTLELGESFTVNETNVNYGVRAVWNILAHKGMTLPIDDIPSYRVPIELGEQILTYSHQPVSSTSGIIRFHVKPGDLVRKGQPVARVYSAFGKLQETITAMESSIVLGYSDSSVAFPGVPVIAFGVVQQ